MADQTSETCSAMRSGSCSWLLSAWRLSFGAPVFHSTRKLSIEPTGVLVGGHWPPGTCQSSCSACGPLLLPAGQCAPGTRSRCGCCWPGCICPCRRTPPVRPPARRAIRRGSPKLHPERDDKAPLGRRAIHCTRPRAAEDTATELHWRTASPATPAFQQGAPLTPFETETYPMRGEMAPL